MGTEPWKGKEYVKEGVNYAASYLSWKDSVEFLKKLTERERSAGRLPVGWSYGLPTESQWEYACRGGSKTRFSFGDDVMDLCRFAWWGGIVGDGNAKSEQYAHEVVKKLKNQNGWHGSIC